MKRIFSSRWNEKISARLPLVERLQTGWRFGRDIGGLTFSTSPFSPRGITLKNGRCDTRSSRNSSGSSNGSRAKDKRILGRSNGDAYVKLVYGEKRRTRRREYREATTKIDLVRHRLSVGCHETRSCLGK
ncbi:hypothetical protein KM043_008834 [Ampulex compressa]|nr:hypothetical protein KM043_008834 [Ampulex compressa]